ncbi:MAG: helix-turn-helix domain-containing protein [Bacteroidetes bacterium]|nr:helix-turn-helix domain-containing protein [Bacteroidota bacterium]
MSVQLSGGNIKIIFGLKIKQLRSEQNLSLVELAEKSHLSVSYLNEIEKGKKYPSGEKIASLSKALDIPYDKLVSIKLHKAHAPIASVLDSKILDEIPFEMFGIDRHKLVELISNAPAKVNAFISTIIEVARNHEFTQEHFLLAVLRSYQESHENYFPELEKSANSFAEKHSINNKVSVKPATLQKILEKEFGYEVNDTELPTYKEIKHMRAVSLEGKKKLLLNPALDDSQRAFIMAREIGFHYLHLKERPFTLPLMKVESFDHVLNNFKASYFAGALLMNEQSLVADMEKFFSAKKWSEENFLKLISKYTSSHETFIHRLTNILPYHFNLNNLFFLRFDNKIGTGHYALTKELHLNQLHNPHGSNLDEHYCRRWVSIRVLKEMEKKKRKSKEPVVGIQRSKYHNSENESRIQELSATNRPSRFVVWKHRIITD